MNLAIVILNWNGRHLLEQFLPSVVEFSKDQARLYVADNASTDDSLVYLKDNFPDIEIIKNKENYGYATGYNQALKQVNADVFILLNSDIEVTKNWLTPIIDHFSTHPNTAAIQPKILDYKNKTHFEYAGAAGGFIDKYGYPYCRGRLFNTLEKDEGQYNDTAKIFWASGACLAIRANIFNDLKGFDDDFFAHQEEIDLCWRIKHLGKDIVYIGASTIYHIGGATLKKSSPRKTFYNFRNGLFMLTKNLSHDLWRILFIRLLLDGIAGIHFLFQGKPMHCLAIIKAHFSFYAGFTKMRRKKIRKHKKQRYYLTVSIIWKYFIEKRKTFVDL
ncbi:MAG: glycosyltransferase family 2 protein [Flavobacteriaceae bacterium]|nr:glycosyltransferase family 2 protein [Flavobacteriaceae bacterium]